MNHVFRLRHLIKNTNVDEVRITATSISFYNAQREPVCTSFSEEITTNPFTRAMNNYLSDLRRTETPTRLPEPAPEGTWTRRLDCICDNILLGKNDQVGLLHQYYYLGEYLAEPAWESVAFDWKAPGITWSIVAQNELQRRIEGSKGREAWRIATRAHQLYQARGPIIFLEISISLPILSTG